MVAVDADERREQPDRDRRAENQPEGEPEESARSGFLAGWSMGVVEYIWERYIEGGPVRNASLPVALIVVGAAWLLWYFRLFPDLDWIIALGLAGGGVAILAIDGITKASVVAGPFLIAAGVAWLVHDRYRTSWMVLIPALLILLGVLMLIARTPRIPERAGRKT